MARVNDDEADGGGENVVSITPKLRAAKAPAKRAPSSRKKPTATPKALPPPPADLREAARSITGLAMETLEDIMRESGSDAARLAAAREVLDRAGGKPKAGGSDSEAGPVTVTIRRFGADGRELGDGEEG